MSRAISPTRLRRKVIAALELALAQATSTGDYQTATRIAGKLEKIASSLSREQRKPPPLAASGRSGSAPAATPPAKVIVEGEESAAAPAAPVTPTTPDVREK